MTVGEQRVRVSFNPSGNSLVDDVKAKTAFLIDTMQELKDISKDGEQYRCCALAQTAYEEAAMWAVKAATA